MPETNKSRWAAHVRSKKWKDFRKGIIGQRGRRCEVCGETRGVMQLHHLTYERLGDELPADVKLLCESCHNVAHGHKPLKRKRHKKKLTRQERYAKLYCAWIPEDRERAKRLGVKIVPKKPKPPRHTATS